MRKIIIGVAAALLLSMGFAQAAENTLLTKAEIAKNKSVIADQVIKASIEHKATWCRRWDAQTRKVCEAQYDWMIKTGEVVLGQLDAMEKVVDMVPGSLKTALALTMDRDRYNAELAMAKYRADIIESAFDPNRRQTALEK